jgi:hypothetical protein
MFFGMKVLRLIVGKNNISHLQAKEQKFPAKQLVISGF